MVEYMENYRVGVGRPPLCKLAAVRPYLFPALIILRKVPQAHNCLRIHCVQIRWKAPARGSAHTELQTPIPALPGRVVSFVLKCASLSVASYFVAVYCHDPS